jgi:hypothetical protein
MIDALSSKLDKAFVISLLTNPGEGADFSAPEAKVWQAAEKLMFCVRTRLYRLRKSQHEGHGFSRAIDG